ncbi:MAG TPA: septation protein SpoVG family protein [Candidatus Bathyarchaeia archaeon]|nr:septation protein SpoVG family protein [Candidatus Bathyarchaeia archaeon]
MKITETRIFIKEGQDKKLKAYATVTFDDAFVVRNIKVIQGVSGMFIAMPSRKLKNPCQRCYFKNEVGSKYCNQCGAELTEMEDDDSTRDAKTEHRDIAHPISQEFRDYLQSEVLKAYQAEVANTAA